MKNEKKGTQFVLEILKNLICEPSLVKNIDSYYFEGIWYMNYDKITNTVWIVYENIWSVLSNEFGYSETEIKTVLKTNIEKIFGWTNFSIKIMY
jgi:hypothetical protein